jgi:dTMP kinase
MPESGKLVVLEGVNDALLGGVAEELCRWLRDAGLSAQCTSEPTYGPAGTQLCLVQQGRLQLDAVSEALLQLADSLDHLQRENGIDAWLEAGHIVVSVHYTLAASARHWGHLEWDWVTGIQELCRKPDLELLIDVTCQGESTQRLRAGYLEAIERLKGTGREVTIVDGRDLGQVQLTCQAHVAKLLNLEEDGC